jgi:hypothetical protein
MGKEVYAARDLKTAKETKEIGKLIARKNRSH